MIRTPSGVAWRWWPGPPRAWATVICTGRSTRSAGSSRSDYDRPETIDETAALVGGTRPAGRRPRLRGLGVTPYVGRAVVALAADPDRHRWIQRSVSSGQLALEYGFIDLDGSRPDVWRYMEEVAEGGLEADPGDYR